MKLEGEIRIPSGCAIAAVISRDGKKMTGKTAIDGISVMHDRSNGLGGGFAGYGIYPEYKDFYAFHLFYTDNDARVECEKYLKDSFEIVKSENIPIRKIAEITDVPLIWRYFVAPLSSVLSRLQLDEKEYVARTVMHINTCLRGCYVFSNGKNMGVFKAVGFPEDVGRFYRLEEYEAYCWTAHGRYDANRRFIEMFGYKCTLQTDTEVITYIADYLLRRQGLTLEETASVIAAPFWSTINEKDEETAKKLSYLRTVFSSLLITGPFSIIRGFEGGLMALNDRLKLRSMVVGEKDDKVFVASEEAALRAMEPNVQNIYAPMGGEPVIVKVKEGMY